MMLLCWVGMCSVLACLSLQPIGHIGLRITMNKAHHKITNLKYLVGEKVENGDELLGMGKHILNRTLTGITSMTP